MCDLIRRQDAIDAHYEYCNKHPDAGFPVWSLKILENLPSAQQDLSGYSDRLWKAAYERGKAEAQQRWIPCSERLPEEKQAVLVTCSDGRVDIYDRLKAVITNMMICVSGKTTLGAISRGKMFLHGCHCQNHTERRTDEGD